MIMDDEKYTKGVSVVIPVYNEEKSVLRTINSIERVLRTNKIKNEIILVEDCSTDSTREVLSSVKSVRIIYHDVNRGYGASLKDGISKAKYPKIAIIDADGTYPAEAIPKMLKYAADYDIVSGSRTGRGAKIPLLRKPAKMILGVLANFLVGRKIQDLNCGLRIIDKDQVMKYFSILPNRFSFTMTHLLSTYGDGGSAKFVRIKYFQRSGESSIHPIKDFLRFMIIIFRSGLLINPIKFFSTISGVFLFLSLAVLIFGIVSMNQVLDSAVTILFSSSVQIFLFGLLADLIIKNNKK